MEPIPPLNKLQYTLLALAVVNVLTGELYMGSTEWSEVGHVNWVGVTHTFNNSTANQYFVTPYSVVTLIHGTFNFTDYFVLYGDIPTNGTLVTIIHDHDGTTYPGGISRR